MISLLLRILLLISASVTFGQTGMLETLRKHTSAGKPTVHVQKMTRADSSKILENLWTEKKWPELKKKLSDGFNPNLPVFGERHLLVEALQERNTAMCEFLLSLPSVDFQTYITLVQDEKQDGMWVKQVRSSMTVLNYLEKNYIHYFYEDNASMVHYYLIKRGQSAANSPNLANILFEYYKHGFPTNATFEKIANSATLYYKVKILDTLIRTKYKISEQYLGDQERCTPIEFAAQQSDTMMVQRLLNAGAMIESISIHSLLQKKMSAATFAYFVRSGITSYEECESYDVSKIGFEHYMLTPLQYCVWKNPDSVWISLLVQHTPTLEKPVLLKELMHTKKEISMQKWMKLCELEATNKAAYQQIMQALKSQSKR